MIELNHFSQNFELSPTLAANETVNRLRAEGRTIIHMGFGQAPFPVHERLTEKLAEHAGNNKYLPAVGISELRDAILSYYSEIMDVNAETHDVIVAPGSKLLLFAVQMAVKGDLLMPVPSWVSYDPQARMLGNEVIKVPTTLDDDGYHIDAQTLQLTIDNARREGLKPKKIILNYPNNPTGLTIPEDELEAIAKVCVANDILIISDEIYGLVSYDKTYRSISKYAPDHTFVTTGLSKHMALGGWRMGLALIPKALKGLTPLIQSIASETWSCVPSPVQYAVMEAYKRHEDVEKYIQDCCEIYDYLNGYIADGLRKIGITCAVPQGAFYVYPNFAPYREVLLQKGVRTSEDLVSHLLETHGLVSLPGTAFGEDPEVLTLRLSACDYNGTEVLQAYRDGEVLNPNFVARHAPNIDLGLDAFAACVEAQSVENYGTVISVRTAELVNA